MVAPKLRSSDKFIGLPGVESVRSTSCLSVLILKSEGEQNVLFLTEQRTTEPLTLVSNKSAHFKGKAAAGPRTVGQEHGHHGCHGYKGPSSLSKDVWTGKF